MVVVLANMPTMSTITMQNGRHKRQERGLRATKVALAVLKVIAGAGLLSMALCAPNALQALGMFDKRYRRQSHINDVLNRLVRRGFVRVVREGKGRTVSLTTKGERYLTDYEDGRRELPRPKKWDGKYRILIFDIWERQRQKRDALRGFLIRLGFVRLQDSVWVYPHECEEIMALLKSRFRVGNGLLYLVAESIENDRWLRREFNLA